MLLETLILQYLSVSFTLGAIPEPRNSLDDYMTDRNSVLHTEDLMFLGANLTLSADEVIVNDYIMQLKASELAAGFSASSYPPSDSFFQRKAEIESSELYAFLRGMPKGAALHIHDTSLTTIDWVVQNITYRENLYMRDELPHLEFVWRSEMPSESGWVNVNAERAAQGASAFDAYLKSRMVITVAEPATEYPDLNSNWQAFNNALTSLSSLLNYVPVMVDYTKQGLEEFLADNIQHMEIRTDLFGNVCSTLDEACNPLPQHDMAGLYSQVASEFLAQHQGDTCGITMLYASVRDVDLATVEGYIQLTTEVMDDYPGFFMGFDLVGQEDLGRPLIDFLPALLDAKEQGIPFYYHAAETDWQGQATDVNVIDALLLGTKRIGHGFGITKHPEAKRLALEGNVPLEVCPISNQVLGLVEDLRNHPATILIQEGFPVVISSDDPPIWEALGLGHDFYEAFMGMSSASMDLRLLKQLVLNSVDYSAMEEAKKDECRTLVLSKWNTFMQTKAQQLRDAIL